MADIIPPRRGEELTPDGKPTVRFSEYLESLTSVTNDTTSEVNSLALENVLSLVNALENRLGSGDFLTSDETGFTVDSDRLSADMDEA